MTIIEINIRVTALDHSRWLVSVSNPTTQLYTQVVTVDGQRDPAARIAGAIVEVEITSVLAGLLATSVIAPAGSPPPGGTQSEAPSR
jgi:hypothetical protein